MHCSLERCSAHCGSWVLMCTGAVLLTMGFLSFPFPFQKWNVSQTKIRIISTIIFILFGCVLFVALPAVIFKHIEGWNTLDAIYFVVITLTTIGFGDYVAGKIFFRNSLSYNVLHSGIYSAFFLLFETDISLLWCLSPSFILHHSCDGSYPPFG